MITTNFQTFLKSRLVRWGIIASGIAVALIATGDRSVFSALNADTGIDPLDVLTTKTRPNVYLVLDSSTSMAEFVDSSLGGANTNEDEPNSKMAQAKAVMRQLVQDNQSIANFALARYKGPQSTLPNTDRFTYATDDVESPGLVGTSALFDLRQFKLGAAYTIPFTEGATNRTSAAVPATIYKTGWDLAAALQTAMNGAAGKVNTYKVAFFDGPGGTDARFTFSTTNASPANLTIRGTAMNSTFRSTLGFANADVAGTVQTVTPPSNGGTYNLASDDAFTFTENGNTRNAILLSSNYNTTALLASGLQNALNAAAVNNTYVVTYTASKYVITTINGGPVSFVINGGTFTSASRTALGFANANASSVSGASSIVSPPNEPSGGEVAVTAHREDTTSFNEGPGKGRTGVPTTVQWFYANKLFLDGTLQIDNASGTPCKIVPAGLPSQTSAAITIQPMTSCDPTASPTATGTAFTFKFEGSDWAGVSTVCQGADQLESMRPCSDNLQIDTLGPYLAPTLQMAGGKLAGISNDFNDADTTDFLGAITFTTSSQMNEQKGIRQDSATPIADSLIGLFGYYNTLWSTATTGIAAQPTGRRQKNFVIFLTDGDDTCERTGNNPPTVTTSNLDNHAYRAAYVASELYKGMSVNPGTTWPPTGTRDGESKVTTFVVVFGVGAQATRANQIAYGGSGMGNAPFAAKTLADSGFGTRWAGAASAAELAACTTCRPAFTAANATDLAAALQSAVNLTQEGEFSDQQSVTESVYEYVTAAPPPGPTVPPTPTPEAQDPMNALTRYSRTVPVILQSTFIMPNFEGHLSAFRNNAGASLELWDAGQKLNDRVRLGVTGTDGMGLPSSPTAEWNFDALRGNADLANIRTSSAKIKRRILTTTGNGKLTDYTAQSLVDLTNVPSYLSGTTAAYQRVPLWPPTSSAAGGLPAISPNDAASSAGALDTPLGLTAAADLAAVQALVPDACRGAAAGACTGGTVATRLAKAKREAREIILAWLAGAQARRDSVDSSKPKRVSNEIVYEARPWVMAESSLAAPAVVAPPPQAESLDFKPDEYLLYRDGPRKGTGTPDPCLPAAALNSASCFAVNGFSSGFGLRNPDLDGSSVDGSKTAQAIPTLKPIMSVVYHATNAGLHAFRAGPCPSTATLSGIGSGMSLGCETGTLETGGEELWAFVPYDQLGKLIAIMSPQKNDASKTYMLAAPVRFSDIWIDGGWSRSVGLSPTPFKSMSGGGVWRTMAFFGRGAGGKFMTGMDITVSGTVGAHTLDTYLPVVVWNRGNDGVDSSFASMGQTWSVPAIGRVFPSQSSNDHLLFVGSGYSPVPAEGSTFYVMSPRTGDVLQSFAIPQGSSTSPNPPFRNRLVASPSIDAVANDKTSPLDFTFFGNPAATVTKGVYFPDLHGRVWKYSPNTPSTPPVLFADARAADGVDQPFANSVALMRFYPSPVASPLPSPPPDSTLHVYVESGNDNRVPVRTSSPFFKMYGFRDSGTYPTAPYLMREFDAKYRGQVQPATGFLGPDKPLVFFAGNKFSTDNAGCISQFDAVLYALNATNNTAAFDLRNDGAASDDHVEITGQRINAIRVAGKALVVDTGLKANIAPPPPEPPRTGQTSTVGASTATVVVGPDPNNAAHAGFRTTTVPFRLGTSTCRANQ